MSKKKKSKLNGLSFVSNKGTDELVALQSKHAAELAKFDIMAVKLQRTVGLSAQFAGIFHSSSGSPEEIQSKASSQMALPDHLKFQMVKKLDKQRNSLLTKHAKAILELESRYS